MCFYHLSRSVAPYMTHNNKSIQEAQLYCRDSARRRSLRRSGSLKVDDFGSNRKFAWHLIPLVSTTNLCLISHPFLVIFSPSIGSTSFLMPTFSVISACEYHHNVIHSQRPNCFYYITVLDCMGQTSFDSP